MGVSSMGCKWLKLFSWYPIKQQQLSKMITEKNKVQPFNQQEEKNYDKCFFVKIFEGTERLAIAVLK